MAHIGIERFGAGGAQEHATEHKEAGAGQALRHTVRTIHAEIGVSDMLSSFLLGHSLDGVNQKYTAELIIIQGKALRAAQEKVSKHIFKLLGLSI
jgi:hypothetical protein